MFYTVYITGNYCILLGHNIVRINPRIQHFGVYKGITVGFFRFHISITNNDLKLRRKESSKNRYTCYVPEYEKIETLIIYILVKEHPRGVRVES